MSRPRKSAVQKPEAAATPTPSATATVAAAGTLDPAAPSQPETTDAASSPAPVSAATAAEAAAASVDPKPDAKTAPTADVVTVRGPAKGRWRIGRHFTSDEVSIPVAELTEAQIAALETDPELTLTWSGAKA